MKNCNRIILGILLFSFLSCKNDKSTIPNDAIYTLNIEVTKDIPKNKKVAILLQQKKGDQVDTYEGKIERRGGYSMSFPKHSYEIDLRKDISLANLPEDDDWILNSNYIDKTFLRHVISYELFTEMGIVNEAPESQFVEVELNGVYNGLYVLMEKLDKSSLDISKKDSTAVIFKEPHLFRQTYDKVRPQKPNNFHQQTYPKIRTSDRSKFIEDTRHFILKSSDTVFTNELSTVFDINNLIDWHLLLLISNNSDGILKNFYLYKVDAETPIRIAPWDYDHSFGRDGDNELNLDKHPLNIERSILFSRLLKFNWYKQKLKAKWNALNHANILSEKGLKQKIVSKSNLIQELATKNFEKWPIDGKPYYDANNFQQEINIMLQFIELRHKRLRAYFNNL